MLCKKYQEQLRWVIYQIYPRSFMDSNGDGIGDLQGIIQKLDYLKDLGVNAVWICPCYKSPNDDNGYDISDYRDIMDEFGTMEDMDALITALHARGMKLIMDLVPNHTSTSHRWFQESRKGKDNPYSDFYYWFDEIPNDWESEFRGSAWEYDPVRGQYYLHSFAVSQADLNWNNPAVVKAMQDTVDFWIEKGVDGFRIDVIDMISKDFSKEYNGFGPRLHEFIHDLFGREKAAHLFTVGESDVHDINEMIRHCAADRGELSTLFLFDHMECGRIDKFTPKQDSLKTLRNHLIHWQQETEKYDLLHSLFTDNHDQPPMISRIGNDREKRYEAATVMAAMLYLLKGVPFIYQGQEIGMPAANYDRIDCFDDIESVNTYKEFCKTMTPEEALRKINFGSRDNARHPMAWSNGANGGFSTGKPWIALHSRYQEINVEGDLAADRSVYRFYQALLALRRSNDAFLNGDLEVISSADDPYFIFARKLGNERWVVVCNFESEQQIKLPFQCEKPSLANLNREAIDGKYASYECAVAKCILRSPAATVAVCERPVCGINGRIFIRKFSSGG
ncbi:MAG: alpha-glucosidase [Acidaminococcaceae bacterium]|jgi:oligo-1,6-glucosidase|nr:alpha-glucosidase [Acidaminococcaceae bacterium]MBR4537638.1 alpha-glucosidase [Clostridia bacterium]